VRVVADGPLLAGDGDSIQPDVLRLTRLGSREPEQRSNAKSPGPRPLKAGELLPDRVVDGALDGHDTTPYVSGDPVGGIPDAVRVWRLHMAAYSPERAHLARRSRTV
jgi:hypothetical protein